jgi:hypothetical protein
VNRLPRWRIALAMVILAGLVVLVAVLAPVYYHNLQLQNFVAGVTRSAASQTQSDTVLREWVVDRARQLDLPVVADNVHIDRSPEGLKIDVRYFVQVDLPGYTVMLHFYPGAGSR